MLIRSAQVGMESKNGEPIRAQLPPGVDWRISLKPRSGMGCCRSYILTSAQFSPTPLPRQSWNSSGTIIGTIRCANFVLTGELLTLLRLFEKQGIRAVPFKGLTLAAFAYGDLGLRDIGDLDLLVRKRDIPRARELLIAQGYQPMFALNRVQEAAYLRSLCQLPFVCAEPPGMVELHTKIMPREFSFPLDFARLWDRRTSISLGGQEVPSFSPEDLLLVLCAHGAKHLWTCLKWICDVAQLIRAHPKMNWEQVVREAPRLAGERMLFLGLFLARDLLQAPLPEEICRRIHTDAVVKGLAAQVRQNLFRDRPPGGFESALFHFRARERFRDGIRYSLSLAVSPTLADWVLISVPPSFSFLYYLLRPIRLVGKYGQQLLISSPRPRTRGRVAGAGWRVEGDEPTPVSTGERGFRNSR